MDPRAGAARRPRATATRVAPSRARISVTSSSPKRLLAYRLLTLHNVRFYVSLMAAMREAIAAGAFGAFRARFFLGVSGILTCL